MEFSTDGVGSFAAGKFSLHIPRSFGGPRIPKPLELILYYNSAVSTTRQPNTTTWHYLLDVIQHLTSYSNRSFTDYTNIFAFTRL